MNQTLALALLAIYFGFLFYRSFKLAQTWQTTRSIRHSALPLEPDERVAQVIRACEREVGTRTNPVTVLRSETLPVPVTIGLRRNLSHRSRSAKEKVKDKEKLEMRVRESLENQATIAREMALREELEREARFVMHSALVRLAKINMDRSVRSMGYKHLAPPEPRPLGRLSFTHWSLTEILHQLLKS